MAADARALRLSKGLQRFLGPGFEGRLSLLLRERASWVPLPIKQQPGRIVCGVLTSLIRGLWLRILVSPVEKADQVHEHRRRAFHLLRQPGRETVEPERKGHHEFHRGDLVGWQGVVSRNALQEAPQVPLERSKPAGCLHVLLAPDRFRKSFKRFE
jgi:hypothetical protein